MGRPRVGEMFTVERTFSREDVRTVAALAGEDRDPVADGRGRLRVQAVLPATLLWGLGTQYEFRPRELHVHAVRPLYSGDRVRCTWEIDSVRATAGGWTIGGSLTVVRLGGSDSGGGRGETERPSVALEATVEGQVSE